MKPKGTKSLNHGVKEASFDLQSYFYHLFRRRLAHNTNNNPNTNSNEMHMLQAREHTVYTKSALNLSFFYPP